MSKNASQVHESADRQPGGKPGSPSRAAVPVRVRGGRGPRESHPERASTGAAKPRTTPAPRAGGELLAYYRLRCIALEAAVGRLADDLERERRRLDEVVTRYESILQERDAAGAVTDSRR
jgi:hypothetical protein